MTTTTPIAPPSAQTTARKRAPIRREFLGALPAPPSDAEAVSYFKRHGRFLAVWYAAGTIGFVIAFTSLIQTEPTFAVFAPYFVLLAAWLGSSTYLNVWPRDPKLQAHIDRVAGWSPIEFPSVDVWLPVCGEPLAVLENTWRAVAQIDWPSEVNVHVGDDRPSEAVRELAEEFGFEYHVRAHPGRMKKAGNLLHLFDNSNGDFIAIFDADFVPRSDFFWHLVPYFDDADVGIVQSPQYFAPDCHDNWLQQGAGAIQEFFYRAAQPGRSVRGGAICVGTSAVYRRTALESNGGPAQVPLSEDVHTGFELMGHGWRMNYVPIVLSAGLCPDTKRSYFNQQYRWCTGSINLVRSRKFWSQAMPIRQRLCFVSGTTCYVTNAMSAICGPPFVMMLACVFPEIVQITNYVVLLPLISLQFVVLPLWNHSRIGLNARSVQMRNSWTHVYAILDVVRRRSAAWIPSGNSGNASPRTKRVDYSILVWTGGLTFAATIGALVNFASRPLDFAPMLAFMLFLLAMVGRNLLEIKK